MRIYVRVSAACDASTLSRFAAVACAIESLFAKTAEHQRWHAVPRLGVESKVSRGLHERQRDRQRQAHGERNAIADEYPRTSAAFRRRQIR
jgi:hypothetical protein